MKNILPGPARRSDKERQDEYEYDQDGKNPDHSFYEPLCHPLIVRTPGPDVEQDYGDHAPDDKPDDVLEGQYQRRQCLTWYKYQCDPEYNGRRKECGSNRDTGNAFRNTFRQGKYGGKPEEDSHHDKNGIRIQPGRYLGGDGYMGDEREEKGRHKGDRDDHQKERDKDLDTVQHIFGVADCGIYGKSVDRAEQRRDEHRADDDTDIVQKQPDKGDHTGNCRKDHLVCVQHRVGFRGFHELLDDRLLLGFFLFGFYRFYRFE